MAGQEEAEPELLYTVIIRVPFPRADFVDPPPVLWDAAKDRSLWEVLSKTPKNSEMDWNALADKYDVSLSFLLQQAAYLYDRQFSQVRTQLRRVAASKPAAPSSLPGTESTGGEAMVRTVSGGGQQGPSSLSARRDSATLTTEGSLQKPAGRAGAPPISRNSSANTTAQIQSRYMQQTSPRPAKAQLHHRSISPLSKTRRPSTTMNTAQPTVLSRQTASTVMESSSEESSSDSDLPAQSRMLRRPRRVLRSSSAEASGDDSPTFLPFSNPAPSAAAPHSASAATLREASAQPSSSRRMKSSEALQSQTSDSSASSTAQKHPVSHRDRDARHARLLSGTGPVPRRTAELAGRSPQSKGKGVAQGRESDGTPSMGSSFSDLDDASVTQSALEEALLSNMQQGMASKMSTLSQAFRSRYL